MGQKIVLAGTTFSDATLPKVYADKIMSAGSLVLLDPSHSLGAWAAGVPANGATFPNIAWERAAAMIAGASQADLLSTFSDSHQAADALFERTSKGALHTIYSQVNNTNNGRGAAIVAAAKVRDYIFANSGHKFYFSQWQRLTRAPAVGGVGSYGGILNKVGGESNNFIAMTRMETNSGRPLVGAATYLGQRVTPADNTLGLVYRALGAQGWSGTPAAVASDIDALLACFGSFSGFFSASTNKAASVVTYRVYIEDLTVSGRSFADVDAIDYSMYQAAFASGGKFYGDTYTAPSTFP